MKVPIPEMLFTPELLAFGIPFSHYSSFSSPFGGTLSHLVVMSLNLDSLSGLLRHFNQYTG
jgi:hypothetical protein